MTEFVKINKKVARLLPGNLAIHDEETGALSCMTLSEKWAFKSTLNQEKLTLSAKFNVRGKAKSKTQLETPKNNSPITRLQQEILLRIANTVPLALTCRRFYLILSNDIKRADLRQLICVCTENDLPQHDMDMVTCLSADNAHFGHV